MPPRGAAEALYTHLRARYGYWSPDFLHVVKVAYRGIIPPRFLALAARLERERPWELTAGELARLEPTGRPPTITLVHPDGRLERWQPTADEWREAAP